MKKQRCSVCKRLQAETKMELGVCDDCREKASQALSQMPSLEMTSTMLTKIVKIIHKEQ